MSDETLLQMDDIDGLTLDDVEEAPDFLVPPSGDYLLGVNSTKINKTDTDEGTRTSIQIIYFVDQTLEVVGDEDPVPNGSLFSENFQVPKGMPFFKNRMKKLLGDITGVNLKDMRTFLEEQYGPGGTMRARALLKKVITTQGKNEYENVRFVKIHPAEDSVE